MDSVSEGHPKGLQATGREGREGQEIVSGDRGHHQYAHPVEFRQVGWSAILPWVKSRAGGLEGARCAQEEAVHADALTVWWVRQAAELALRNTQSAVGASCPLGVY